MSEAPVECAVADVRLANSQWLQFFHDGKFSSTRCDILGPSAKSNGLRCTMSLSPATEKYPVASVELLRW